MRKLILQMNVSLDGVADHRVAYADDELHDFAARELDDVDVALFGRKTYELMASYWPVALKDPGATASMIAFAKKFNALPKIVFSRTLTEANWNNTTLFADDAAVEVTRLKAEPGKNLSIGGIAIGRDFMQKGLIDEYVILVQPIVWGEGIRLFDGIPNRTKLVLTETKKFASGVVVLRYAAAVSA